MNHEYVRIRQKAGIILFTSIIQFTRRDWKIMKYQNRKPENLHYFVNQPPGKCASYINNCPTRCNTKQSIYYSASSRYIFRVSTTSIISSTQNCHYSLQRGQASLATLEGGSCSTEGCSYSFVYCCCCVWLTPETCRVNMQNNKQIALCCISLDSY